MMETVLNIGLNDDTVLALEPLAPVTSASPGTPTAGCCRCSVAPCWRAGRTFRPTLEEAKADAGATRDIDLDADELRDARR